MTVWRRFVAWLRACDDVVKRDRFGTYEPGAYSEVITLPASVPVRGPDGELIRGAVAELSKDARGIVADILIPYKVSHADCAVCCHPQHRAPSFRAVQVEADEGACE
jgi:hypothetical protein